MQVILMDEGELKIRLKGYASTTRGKWAYYLACFFSFGLVYLISRWLPKYWKRWNSLIECSFEHATIIEIENSWNQTTFEKIQKIPFESSLKNVFPASVLKNQHIISAETVGSQDSLTNDPNSETISYLSVFEYRSTRFILHPSDGIFYSNSYYFNEDWNNLFSPLNGLQSDTAHSRNIVFGDNIIEIPQQSTPSLLLNEVLHPFNVFQALSVVLWFFYEYVSYALCILAITLFSIFTTLRDTRKNLKNLQKMARYECKVKVIRNGKEEVISSLELVPGDYVQLHLPTMGNIVPCDLVLLRGDCIVNESMLTGESIPVPKIVLPSHKVKLLEDDLMNEGGVTLKQVSKSILFSGTKFVRVRGEEEERNNECNPLSATEYALAMVVRTGFNTSKGHLMRAILYPKPLSFKFYTDAIRFVQLMAIIAVIGFILTCITLVRNGVPTWSIMLRACDLITIVVPPALPATMSIGTSFALSRLRSKLIFCISPSRINMCGKLNLLCFDKTGTLTEEGLDVHGLHIINFNSKLAENPKFLEVITPNGNNLGENLAEIVLKNQGHFLQAMVTCHSLHCVDGELIGDPLDIIMFEHSEWELVENSSSKTSFDLPLLEEDGKNFQKQLGLPILAVVNPPSFLSNSISALRIHKRFDFVSKLCRMSAVVSSVSGCEVFIYCKGAPEVIKTLCRPCSIPEDFEEQLFKYAHRGYRVLACAWKPIDLDCNSVGPLSFQRNEIESELFFCGFIIFANKLKEESQPAIQILQNAAIRQVMCTGDNLLTAISVSKECGIVHIQHPVFVPRIGLNKTYRSSLSLSDFVWEDVDNERNTLDPLSLQVQHSKFQSEFMNLAITGDMFTWLSEFAPKPFFDLVLRNCNIFARMSPEHKQLLVEAFQEKEFCVGFCGDGANDCGALKAANVGLSLSEAEASVAAPFTSRTCNIECTLDIIREGRAALVTSFSCFKYMALYSLIQFTTVSYLYSFGSNLGDHQFLYIDLFLIFPLAIFMARTRPCKTISQRRPSSRLMSSRVIVSLLGQFFIQFVVQTIMLINIRRQSFYTPPSSFSEENDPEATNGLTKCYENTVLFLVSMFQYIFVAVVYSDGPPFRQRITSNIPYIVTALMFIVVGIIITLYPNEHFLNWMELVDLPFQYRVTIILVVVTYVTFSFAMEQWVFPQLVGYIEKLFKMKRQRQQKITCQV